jgi:uncharacterized protein YdaU (DUF1376 family)
MNYCKRHIGDMTKKCAHLNQGQIGAYVLLLDWYFGNERPIPVARMQFENIAHAKTRTEKINVQVVLDSFFTLTPEGYVDKYAELELKAYQDKSAKARASANIGWTQRVRNANASENEMRTHSDGNASHKPLTINQKAFTKDHSAIKVMPTSQVPDKKKTETKAENDAAFIKHVKNLGFEP